MSNIIHYGCYQVASGGTPTASQIVGKGPLSFIWDKIKDIFSLFSLLCRCFCGSSSLQNREVTAIKIPSKGQDPMEAIQDQIFAYIAKMETCLSLSIAGITQKTDEEVKCILGEIPGTRDAMLGMLHPTFLEQLRFIKQRNDASARKDNRYKGSIENALNELSKWLERKKSCPEL